MKKTQSCLWDSGASLNLENNHKQNLATHRSSSEFELHKTKKNQSKLKKTCLKPELARPEKPLSTKTQPNLVVEKENPT